MSADDPIRDTGHEPFSLRRWSRRKLGASGSGTAANVQSAGASDESSAQLVPGGSAAPDVRHAPGQGNSPQTTAVVHAGLGDTHGEPSAIGSDRGVAEVADRGVADRGHAAVGANDPLPPIESLHFDSDFTAFLQPRIDESLKRAALKRLFQDPRFNVMDGLDVYIDDYTQFEVLSPEEAHGLVHARALFEPPQMVVDAEGHAIPAPPPPAELEAGIPGDDHRRTEADAVANIGAQTDDAPAGCGAAQPAAMADPGLPSAQGEVGEAGPPERTRTTSTDAAIAGQAPGAALTSDRPERREPEPT